jgi:hypothetical protein
LDADASATCTFCSAVNAAPVSAMTVRQSVHATFAVERQRFVEHFEQHARATRRRDGAVKEKTAAPGVVAPIEQGAVGCHHARLAIHEACLLRLAFAR